MPESCPSAVIPSDEKQDANQLRIDIPKWKQWLSPQSWEEWEEFLLSGLDKLGGTSQEPSQWPLELLASTTQANSLPPDNDNNETLLLTKERQECLVRIITYNYSEFFLYGENFCIIICIEE